MVDLLLVYCPPMVVVVYGSTTANANRKRANTVSRLFLCQDYLLRPISFERDINLLDGDAVETAIQTDPACVGCHNTLDPLAAHFFGFWSPAQNSWLDLVSYHPEREILYASILGVQPAYYGQESQNLSDLDGTLPAMSAGMCGRQMVELASNRRLQTLNASPSEAIHAVKAQAWFNIVLSSGTALGYVKKGLTIKSRLLHVDQLASSVEALTGFRWTYNGRDVLRSGTYGLRVLAGGADGETVFEAATAPSPTMLLTQTRLAELAASYAVETEAQQNMSSRQLFTLVDLNNAADPQRKPNQQPHLQALAQPVDADGPKREPECPL